MFQKAQNRRADRDAGEAIPPLVGPIFRSEAAVSDPVASVSQSCLRRGVAALLGEASVGSVRSHLTRPAILAFCFALFVGIAVASGRPGFASVLVFPAVFFITFAVSFGVERIGQLEKSVAEMRGEALSLWSLSPLGTPGGVILPPMGGYALSPGAAAALLGHVVYTQPATVVELGPGSSTVLLVRLSSTLTKPLSITCVEHDRRFSEKVGDAVRYHGGSSVTIIDASLQPLEIDGWRGHWYDSAALERLPHSIDMLVVDGPPEGTGIDARYPAYPLLGDRLKDGALVFVDDTGRAAERSMVRRWVAMGGLTVIQEGGSYMVLRKHAN